MKHYEVLIFDWDGTVMDSRAAIVECLKLAIKECGHKMPDDIGLANLIGLGLQQAFERLYPDLSVQDIEQLSGAFRRAFLLPGMRTSVLFPKVRETLDVLKENYLLAVATGKSRSGLDRDLQRAGLERYFPITRTADETLSKPNPAMLFEIITDLNTEASRCLVIGDTDYDLNMARNANVDAVAVTCGVHDQERLQAAEPLALLSDISELPAWLAQA